MKIQNPLGTVIKVDATYVVVKWDDINGHWHYTYSQLDALRLIPPNKS
jgi:hypothetical protein